MRTLGVPPFVRPCICVDSFAGSSAVEWLASRRRPTITSMRSVATIGTIGTLATLALPALAAAPLICSGCSAAPPAHPQLVAPAPPPKDDGKPAEGGEGGAAHAAALEQLKIAPLGARADRQESLRVPLPDGGSWTRIKFWGMKSLVGFRYGKDHHSFVGGFVVHVDDENAPGA